MEPREFEDAVAKIFRKLGYKVAQTPYVGDGGKDAVAWKDGIKYVIECKRYGSHSATGRRDIQILMAAKSDEGADGAIFVTTGRLTAPALAYAKENAIEYYDQDKFGDLVNRAYGVAGNYLRAQTICLECGRTVAVRIQKTGPSTGICRGTATGPGSTHDVTTSIEMSHLKYPALDLEAP
jgi:hypothetical protein